MKKIVELRAGWGTRPETLKSVAKSVVKMLMGFGECDEALKEWCFHDPPFAAAPMEAAYFEKRLARSGRSTAVDARLGWGLRAWSGKQGNSFALSISVGLSSRLIGNAITLTYPYGVTPGLATVRCLASVLVSVWQPEYVAYNPVTSPKIHNFELGDMTFISPKLESILDQAVLQECESLSFQFGKLFAIKPDQIERIYESYWATTMTR